MKKVIISSHNMFLTINFGITNMAKGGHIDGYIELCGNM